MGNYLSCVYSISPRKRGPSAIRVLHAYDGRISEFDEPMKVAELMLEFANHFVVEYSSLHCGKRVNALSADDEMRLSRVYILLPMQKLNKRLSAEELDFFAATLSKSPKAKGSRHGQRKVAPYLPDLHVEEDILADSNPVTASCVASSYSLELRNIPQLQNACTQRHMSTTKSWVPKLETISESSVLEV